MNFLKPILSYEADGSVDSVYVALAAGNVVTTNVPRRARIARVRVGQVTNYILTQPGSSANPTNDVGFPIKAGVTDIEVGAQAVLKLINTHASTATGAYIEYFGSDRGPVASRVVGSFQWGNMNSDNVQQIPADPTEHRRATHLKVRASQPIHVTFGDGGGRPTANHGIYIPGDTTTNIPCYKGQVFARRATATDTFLMVQAYEDFETGGNVYGEEVFIPLPEVETNGGAVLGSGAITIPVPKRAEWAWISANTAGLRYTVNGENPTSSQRGFDLAANATAKVPVVGGSDLLRVLRSAANARVTVCFFALG